VVQNAPDASSAAPSKPSRAAIAARSTSDEASIFGAVQSWVTGEFSVVVREWVGVLVRRRGYLRVIVRTWRFRYCRDQSRSAIWRPSTG
jgi:hypothetical protein